MNRVSSNGGYEKIQDCPVVYPAQHEKFELQLVGESGELHDLFLLDLVYRRRLK